MEKKLKNLSIRNFIGTAGMAMRNLPFSVSSFINQTIKTEIPFGEDFCKRKSDWIPDDIRNELGHFNVIKLDPYVGNYARPVPYKKRDFYKSMLEIGSGKVHYADRVLLIMPEHRYHEEYLASCYVFKMVLNNPGIFDFFK